MSTIRTDVDYSLLKAYIYDYMRKNLRPSRRPTINEDIMYSVVNTKRFRKLDEVTLAVIIVNRCLQAERRLSHQTGAEGWL